MIHGRIGKYLTVVMMLVTTVSPVAAFAPTTRLGSFQQQDSFRFEPTSSPTRLDAAQYAGQAIGLFNNMKTPASIIAGAIVPLGFLAPLQITSDPDDTVWERRARRFYAVLSAVTLATELIAVMWATVATNQLTETAIRPAESVWHLLKRDFELEWAAVNTHFVIGMLGFLSMIGSRAYFMAQKGLLGKSVLGVAVSGLALMVSIVNRGVAAGGGAHPTTGTAMRYGASVLALARRYTTLLVGRAIAPASIGPIEIISVSTFVLSVAAAMRAVWKDEEEEEEEEEQVN